MIELIGESNISFELLDLYDSDVWFKQEKTGLIYVNHFRWNKAFSKNLLLEIFDILKPKPLTSDPLEQPLERDDSISMFQVDPRDMFREEARLMDINQFREYPVLLN